MEATVPEFLTTKEAATLLRLSAGTLNKLRCYGGGPRFLKLGGAVRYKLDDLRAWIEDRARENTAQR